MSDDKDRLIEKNAELDYDKASKDFKYPKGIVDNGAYDSYLSLTNVWKSHPQRIYKCKFNKKIEIDLAQPTKYIDDFIEEHKPPKGEEDLIRSLNVEIYSIVMKSIIFKKKAFGDNRALLGDNGSFVPDELSGITPIVIDLFGRFFKVEEVHQVVQQDLEITNVTLYQLKQIYKDNIAKIKELQEKFKTSYSDCRLGYKRSRIEELQYIYNERKQIYQAERRREDEVQLIKLLEQIKKECDGDLVINGNLNIKVEQTLDIFVKQEILKDLNISMFVLARVAGKLNINPLSILSRLANSRYAQFTGYAPKGLSQTALTDEIQYPSNLTYNWNVLTQKCEEVAENDKKAEQLPEIKKVDRVLSIKEQLLSKLEKAKEPLNNGKNNVNNDIKS